MTKENPLDWEGVNLQVYSLVTPNSEERELNLYLFCIGCKAIKDFTVTQSLTDLWNRKTKFIEYGTTCNVCGTKAKVRIEWQDKPSWKFFTRESWDKEIKPIEV